MTMTVEPGMVRLAATLPVPSDPDAVAAMLDRGPEGWEELGVEAGYRRFAVDLRLRIGGEASGITTFHKAAYVHLGPRRPAGGGFAQEIGWRAATAAPLFPVFSGDLRVERESMSISGLYAPPGGVIGLVADRALLHVAATGTARWLLHELHRAAMEEPA
jgi:hypothetical protein